MKKFLFLTIMCFILGGCRAVDLTADRAIDDINDMQKMAQDDGLSEEMHDSMFIITGTSKLYAQYLKDMNIAELPHRADKEQIIDKLTGFKQDIASAKLTQKTDLDEVFYSLMYNYQYNAEMCLKYMIKFIESGDKSDLDLHNSYLKDLRVVIRDVEKLGNKYDLVD